MVQGTTIGTQPRSRPCGGEHVVGERCMGSRRRPAGPVDALARRYLQPDGRAGPDTWLCTEMMRPVLSESEAMADALHRNNRPWYGARGPYSHRVFDPHAAGGPVRRLSTATVRIIGRGIDVVERHLSRFEPDEANQAMLARLRRIAVGELEPTPSDLNFYTHELREYVRYRRLGWLTGQPSDVDLAHELWSNAHTATLEDYGLREGPGVLYHPSIEHLV